ncbi:MAG TPA: amidohydrolase [Planctomycetaceae bacterium]
MRLLTITLVALAAPAFAEEPSLVVFGGKVVTVDRDFSVAEAMAIAGDRILAVGTNEEIRKLAGPRTERLDLEGKTVLPGLIDSHVHPVGAAMYEFDHPIPEMETVADVLAYVARRAEELPDGEWIKLQQVFVTRLRDQRYPTREELDRAAPKNPVVFRTGPDAALNSLALAASGIDKDFEITDGGPGQVERDPRTGEPTGILRGCTRLIKDEPSGREPTAEDRYRRLKELFAAYNRVGITSVSDRGANEESLDLYRRLKENGELTCRVYAHQVVADPLASEEEVVAQIEAIAADPLRADDPLLRLGGIKLWLDGGMLTGSAYMLRPWGVSDIYSIRDPEYRGMLLIPPDRLEFIVRLATERGLQPTAHSVGDGAVTTLLDAYESIARDRPIRDLRPCVTHCNFMTAEAIERMKRLGVVADLQPAWLYLDGATLLKQFGDERLAYFQPYRSLFDAGVVVGGGSDHMQKLGARRSVNPYDPFLGMWTTLTRQPRWTDEPLHPEQRITREEAIRLYTINNAYLTFEEDRKGSLEPGKLADFVILDRDLLACPVGEVQEARVERTYLGGRVVYERGSDDAIR